MIASLLQVNKNNTDDDDYYYLKPLFYMMADKFEKWSNRRWKRQSKIYLVIKIESH